MRTGTRRAGRPSIGGSGQNRPVRYSFDDVVIDTDRFFLERDGADVRIEPQVFDVLAHLLEHRDRVVAKTELLDEIWRDRFVSESALTSRIKTARRIVGDCLHHPGSPAGRRREDAAYPRRDER